jgi:hypothetical protein
MLDRSHASRGGAELATVAYVEGDGQMELRARQAEMTHVEPMPFRLPPDGGGTGADRAV